MTIYKDFAGLNLCIYDPILSDLGVSSKFSLLQPLLDPLAAIPDNAFNTFGYNLANAPANYSYSLVNSSVGTTINSAPGSLPTYTTTIQVPQNQGINVWYNTDYQAANSPNSGLTEVRDDSKTLVLLNLHRNGVWGYSSWKQVRLSENSITRKQKTESCYAHVPPCITEEITNEVSSEVVKTANFAGVIPKKESSFLHSSKKCSPEYTIDPVVTSKYFPLQYNFGYMMKDSRLAEFTLKADLTNECRHFASDRLNDLYTVQLFSSDDYEQASVMYLNNTLNNKHNPIDSIELIKYREVVYPREVRTYLASTRGRTLYRLQEELLPWRDDRLDRNIDMSIRGQPLSAFALLARSTTTPRRSRWPLDPSWGYVSYKNLNTNTTVYSRGIYYLARRGGTFGSYNSLVGFRGYSQASLNDSLYTGINANDETILDLLLPYFNTLMGDPHDITVGLDDAGVLQNNSSQFAYFDYEIGSPGSFFTDATSPFVLLPTYYRRNTTAHPNSFVAPSGLPIDKRVAQPVITDTDSNGNVLYPHLSQRELYSGEAVWTAPLMAGSFRTRPAPPSLGFERQFVPNPKAPFYDTYDKYAEHISRVGKDYGVVPEFNISNNLEFYLKAGASEANLGFLEVIGGSDKKFTLPSIFHTNNSSLPNFFETYSNSDFLKLFDVVVEDNKDTITPSVLKLNCKAIKKFMPYRGFYPAERTVDIGEQFYKSYAKNVEIFEGCPLNIYPNLGTNYTGPDLFWMYTSKNAKDYMTANHAPYPRRNNGGRSIKPIHTALFSPGILFNTIKSGIAVDWPNVTSSQSGNTIAAAMGYFNHKNYLAGELTETDKLPGYQYSFRDFSLVGDFQEGSIDGHPSAPGPVCPYFSNRIPFEALSNPEEYMSTFSITDTDPDMLGQTALINRLGAPVDNYYKLMVNNFLAEVPRFFLEKKRFSTFKSRKQGDPKFGNVPDDSKLYGMRVKIRRTMKNPRYRHVAEGISGDETSGAVMLPQDRAADPTLTDNIQRVQENFTMYSRVSAFGPPCAGIAPNSKYFSFDQFNHIQGYNFCFTPPYYHGESWVDLIFNPSTTGSNTINDIFRNTTTHKIRFWQGKNNEFGTQLPDAVNAGDWMDKFSEIDGSDNICAGPDSNHSNSTKMDFPDNGSSPNDHGIEKTGLGARNLGVTLNYNPGPVNIGGGLESVYGTAIKPGEPPTHHCATTRFYHGPQFSHGIPGGSGSLAAPINENAMHVDSSVNLFIKASDTTGATAFEVNGLTFKTDSEADEESRWIIQSKFECPMLNFNHIGNPDSTGGGRFANFRDSDPHPFPNDIICKNDQIEFFRENNALSSEREASLREAQALGAFPKQFDSLQQPRGMWHQYGRLPTEDEGVFIEITDIPDDWWRVTKKCIYNYASSKEVLSLADLVGFQKGQPQRMGEIADRRIIREAIVAVPFKKVDGRRKYYAIDPDDWELAIDNYRQRKSEENTVGNSITRMVRHMDTYVIPPEMDFLNRKGIDPFAMYFFEFTHELSKQDLADIWQNLQPQIGIQHEMAEVEVRHELLSNELLGTKRKHSNASKIIKDDKQTLFDSEIKWMVFKVKQRAHKSYKNLIFGEPKETIGECYNWPYDYFSLVELVKLEAEVELSDIQQEETGQRKPRKITSKRFQMGDINFDRDK